MGDEEFFPAMHPQILLLSSHFPLYGRWRTLFHYAPTYVSIILPFSFYMGDGNNFCAMRPRNHLLSFHFPFYMGNYNDFYAMRPYPPRNLEERQKLWAHREFLFSIAPLWLIKCRFIIQLRAHRIILIPSAHSPLKLYWNLTMHGLFLYALGPNA